MRKSPKVSILIPVYKAQEYIEECLCSVFEQTYNNIEVILVDDASPDESIEIAKKVAIEHGCYDSMKIFRNKKNEGIAHTRNVLIEHASGDYIYFIDSDDFIVKNAIELFVSNAIKEDADIVRCNFYKYWNGSSMPIKRILNKNHHDFLYQCLSNISEMQSLWVLFIRKGLISNYGLRFAENINGCEDFLMTVKLFFYAKKIYDIDDPLYYYRIDNELSITHQEFFFHTNVINAIEETDIFLKKKSIDQKYKDQLLRLKFISKQPFLLNKTIRDIDKYISTFPESNKCYHQFNYSWKQTFLFYLAEHKCLALLKITSKLSDMISKHISFYFSNRF